MEIIWGKGLFGRDSPEQIRCLFRCHQCSALLSYELAYNVRVFRLHIIEESRLTLLTGLTTVTIDAFLGHSGVTKQNVFIRGIPIEQALLSS